MAKLPDLVARIRLDTSKLDKSLTHVNRSVAGMGKSFDNVSGRMRASFGRIAKAAAFAGTAVATASTAIAVKSVKAASDFNEQLSKVGVVFGKSVKIVTDGANEMAKKFGIPKTQFLEAAGAIGLIGKASGLSEGEAATLGVRMAKLAIDASSFYNVPLAEALTSIRSGLVGEAEPMRRFGVLLNAQAVTAEAARLGLQKVGKEYTEGAKAQARASLITKGMTDATGDLERTQDSFANRMREVQGRWQNFSVVLGEKLLPLMERLFEWAERNGPFIADWFSGMAEQVRFLAEWFRLMGEKVAGWGRALYNAGMVLVDAQDHIGNFFIALRGWAGAAAEAVGNLLEKLNNIPGIGLVKKAVGFLGKIPGFAQGGVVPGPIGAPQLAVVHGGERIIPNGGGGGMTVNQNIYGGQSPDDIARAIAWQGRR